MLIVLSTFLKVKDQGLAECKLDIDNVFFLNIRRLIDGKFTIYLYLYFMWNSQLITDIPANTNHHWQISVSRVFRKNVALSTRTKIMSLVTNRKKILLVKFSVLRFIWYKI